MPNDTLEHGKHHGNLDDNQNSDIDDKHDVDGGDHDDDAYSEAMYEQEGVCDKADHDKTLKTKTHKQNYTKRNTTKNQTNNIVSNTVHT